MLQQPYWLLGFFQARGLLRLGSRVLLASTDNLGKYVGLCRALTSQ